jgi:putative membrane protein
MGTEVEPKAVDRLEARVTEVEASTSAEIVVVLAGQSGGYRDLAVIGGSIAALVALLLLLYLPIRFPAASVVPLTVLAGVAGAALLMSRPALLRPFALEGRKRQQVRDAARVSFVDEAVSATRERTGVMIYVSLLESMVEVLPDHGLDRRLARGSWNALVEAAQAPLAAGNWEQAVDDLLVGAEPLLAEHFPCSEDNPDEIPNRPRVLP